MALQNLHSSQTLLHLLNSVSYSFLVTVVAVEWFFSSENPFIHSQVSGTDRTEWLHFLTWINFIQLGFVHMAWEKRERSQRISWENGQPRPIVSWDSQDSLRPCGQSQNLQWEQTQTWRLRISRVDKNFCLWTLQWVDMEAFNATIPVEIIVTWSPPWWRSCFSIVYHVNAS